MKRFVKVCLAGVLCLTMLLCAVSCAMTEEEAPQGMKIATAAGADYRFYGPALWNVNTAYGVSGAYYNYAKQSTVSMVKAKGSSFCARLEIFCFAYLKRCRSSMPHQTK